jgi:alkaline phosphatase
MRLPLLSLIALVACTPAPPKGNGVGAGVGDTDTQPDTDADTDPGTDTDTATDTDTDTDSGGTDTDTDTGDPPIPDLPPAIVLFIGDGMGQEHVAGGGLLATGSRDGLMLRQAPHQGTLRTASLGGYTDSAAAATTLATGTRTWNTKIGRGPNGADLETLLDLATARGMATGVVTTDAVTGATPSSFLVHVDSRYQYNDIADALVFALPDVLMGGGADRMVPRLTGDLMPDGVPDVQLVQTAEELAAATEDERPLVGFFAQNTLPFVFDGRGDAPDLPTMVGAALDRLEDDPEGFLLIVEAARIDHASHLNLTDRVHHETVELDNTVTAVLARSEAWTERGTTVVVTADHECGGIGVPQIGTAGETPTTTWRWGDHTNSRVGVYAWGPGTEALADTEGDHRDAHAAVVSALTGLDPVAPTADRLADGDLDDLGAPIAVQAWSSDHAGWSQLDALRVAADEGGLWIGVDGVFNDNEHAVLAWIDLDAGAGTGVGADMVIEDHAGALDHAIASMVPGATPEGVGFDAVVGTLEMVDVRLGRLYDLGGARVFHPPSGEAANLWWMPSIVNADFSRVARMGPVEGVTTGTADGVGLELRVPWESLAPDGLPPDGTTVAIAVTLSDAAGTWASNQALPSWPTSGSPEPGALQFESVVWVDVDAAGVATGTPVVAP